MGNGKRLAGWVALAGWVVALWVGPVQAQQAQPAQPAQPAAAEAGPATPAPSPPVPEPPPVRIRDLVRVEGLRDNQLVGLGLVVGLNGTGDGRGTMAHAQMLANMLRNFGVTIDLEAAMRVRNAAVVTVTALLPPLARPGDRLDVTVSSLGDARSLAGGVLLQTPLQGADGQVYAVAQGGITLGGSPDRWARDRRVHPTVGRVASGAIVEQSVPATIVEEQGGARVRLVLHWPDFTTARRIVEAINGALNGPMAVTQDGAVVVVRVPDAFRQNPAALLSTIEELAVVPAAAARVVVSERTGTVVMGHTVRIAPVAVAHAGITVQVGSAGDPLAATGSLDLGGASAASPVLLPPPAYPYEAPAGHAAVVAATASVGELVEALNTLGVAPRDLIAILEAIRAAGALYGQLEVI